MKDRAIEVLRANNRSLHREVLDNGMVCLVKQDSSAPVVSVQVWVRTGAIHEDRMLGSGLSHAIEHMIFKGTAEMSPGDVSRLISNAGGHINAYTSFDRTVFHADLPSESWTVGLDVISDALKDPAFPEDEWKKERDVILREFAMGRDDPHRVLDKLLWRTAFTVHPHRFPVIGLEDTFKRIDRDDLMTFFRENYVADNMITVVVGDVETAKAMEAIRKAFGSMPTTPRRSALLPQEPRQLAPRCARSSGKWNISRCEMAYHTVSFSSPDAVALDIIAEIVSQGRSSRFVKRLQEEKQLVNTIAAYSFTPLEPGLFGLYMEFDPAREKDALAALEEEFTLLLRDGFTEDELAKARTQALSASLSPLQTMKGQAGSYASGEFYAADPFFITGYLEHLASLTTGDLLRVTRKYLVPENRTTVLIVPEGAEETSPGAAETARASIPSKRITRSGTTLITRQDNRLPFVYVCAVLGDGFLSETEKNCGITRLMSDMLVRGTGSLTSEQLALEVESRGGAISPFSGINSFGLRARCLTDDAPRFMELLADCLVNPSFPGDELEKQRKLHISAIQQEKERPIALAQEKLRAMMFPSHPYRFNPLGTEESVRAIDRSMLVDFHRRLLARNRMVLSVFGDISPEQAEGLAESAFAGMPGASDGMTAAATPQFALPAREVVHAPREQTVILIGCPGFSINDPRNDALILLDTAMSGLASEMAMEVRERRGLAYFVGSYQQLALQTGLFVMYAGTHEDARDEVERLMLQEAVRVTTKGLTEEEFSRAKTQVISSSDMSLQNSYDMAMKSAVDELLGNGFEHAFRARERFNSLTIASVRDAAAQLLLPNRMATAILVPQTKQ